MPAYPGAIPSFTQKLNNVDNILAGHINDPQDEIIALASALGVSPNVSPSTSTITGYVSGPATWNNVADRITNIEYGVVGDVHTQYVRVTGGSTIVPSTTSTTGVIVKAATGQTANLQEWQDSSGAVVTSIDNTGALKVGGNLVPAVADIEELKAASWLGIGIN